MEKITFVNNSEPYLSAENLNQLQTNIEKELEELKNKSKLLWTNSNASSNFDNSLLGIDLSTYDEYEIIFNESTSFKTKVGYGGKAYIIQDANGNFTGSPYIYLREITSTKSGITIGACRGQQSGTTGTWSTNNARLIPLHIIGHRH